MEIRPFSELIQPDQRTLRFTPLGLSTMGTLSPEDAAEFQQQCVASADLVADVPEAVRQSFDRLRTCHAYGVLWYDAFTVASDLTNLVLEQALRERFVQFYKNEIPLADKAGQEAGLVVNDFDEILEAMGRNGQYRKGGWRLRLSSTGALIALPKSLEPLLAWAHREHLLIGQRNKRMEPVRAQMRHMFAHGAAGFRIGMPNESARAIRDLAEMINRLWGSPTPGGRLYPAPLAREVIAVAWAEQGLGLSYMQLRPDQIERHLEVDPSDWTYLLLLAVPTEEELWGFDARYEMTAFPAEWLWGPGNSAQAVEWSESNPVETDTVDYLDRLFAVRVDNGKVYLVQRPSVFLTLPQDRRNGEWHLVRADFPLDAWNHVRHHPTSCRAGGNLLGGCAVEDVAVGSWDEVAPTAWQDRSLVTSRNGYLECAVPRRWPFPDQVGI